MPRLKAAGIPVLSCENLYADPFLWARRTLEWLHLGDHHLLPSYLFTPAMTTHRTLHRISGLPAIEHPLPADFFWRTTLDRSDQDAVLGVAENFGVDLYAADGSPREPSPAEGEPSNP